MGEWSKARIQLCGRFAVDIDGSASRTSCPAVPRRVVFAYLVLNRGRALPRDQLLVAGWGEDTPQKGALRVCCCPSSGTAWAPTGFAGGPRSSCSAAGDLHRRRRPWRAPTGRSRPSPRDGGHERGARPGSPTSPPGRSWPNGRLDRWRRRLEEVRLRGLECFAAAGLGLGGPALAEPRNAPGC